MGLRRFGAMPMVASDVGLESLFETKKTSNRTDKNAASVIPRMALQDWFEHEIRSLQETSRGIRFSSTVCANAHR